MSWDEWSAIGQLVGAFGVIVSLIFVGVQIRQGTRATKAAAFQQLVATIVDVNNGQLANSHLTDIVGLAMGGQPLSSQQHLQYIGILLNLLRLAESIHYQFEMGLLDERKLDSLVVNLGAHLRTESGRKVWGAMRDKTDPSFRAFAEQHILKAEGALPTERPLN